MRQAAGGRRQDAGSKRQSDAFIRVFVETQPVSGEDADDEAWVAQMTEWLTSPRAPSSANVIRRVIARVECLA